MDQQVTPEPILQLGLAFWGSKTLLSAVELGLFTHLAKGPCDAKTVAMELELHPKSVRDFLDALVSLGMLERAGAEADGSWRWPTPACTPSGDHSPRLFAPAFLRTRPRGARTFSALSTKTLKGSSSSSTP